MNDNLINDSNDFTFDSDISNDISGSAQPNSVGSGTGDSLLPADNLDSDSDVELDISSSDPVSVDFTSILDRLDSLESGLQETIVDYSDNLIQIHQDLSAIIIIFIAFATIWVFRKLFDWFN